MHVIHAVLGLPLVSFPSSGSSNISLWMLVTFDHVTKVDTFSFLYCWNNVGLFICHFSTSSFLLFSFRKCSSSSKMPTFQTIAILSYSWWLLSTFHIRIKRSTTQCNMLLYWFFSRTYVLCPRVISNSEG